MRRIPLVQVRAACATLAPPRAESGADPATRPAAVLMPFFEEGGEAHVILTKRPETMPSHQGEIAFPGGKHEPALDADLRATALREAHEEIGLDPKAVEIVGELDHLVTVSARFAVAPFVGLLPARPDLAPHPREVDAVFDVAISELLHEDVFREEHWDFPPDMLVGVGPDRAIHFFELAGERCGGRRRGSSPDSSRTSSPTSPAPPGRCHRGYPEAFANRESPRGSRDRDRQVGAAGLRLR